MMFQKEQILSFIKKMGTFFMSKDMLVFIFFLIISSIFWVIISLNKTFEDSILIPISYKNAPTDLLNSGTLPETIKLKIKDKGTNLLGYKSFKPITIDFNDYPRFAKNKRITIQSDRFEPNIRKQLQPTTVIVDYDPETIEINDIDLVSKEVDVIFNNNIKCKTNYFVCDTPFITPKRITIYGEANTIDSIKSISTNIIKANNLQNTISGMVKLALPKHTRANTDSVQYTIPISEAIEMSIMVPVTVHDVPKGLIVKTIPTEVEVFYKKGMNNKRVFTSNDFTISIDYDNIIGSNSTDQKEPLTIDYHTEEAWNVRLSRPYVNWVIEIGIK